MAKSNTDIEVLRAIAIGFVLVEHASILLAPANGVYAYLTLHFFRPWTGVDLFFVVSGFVIASSLYRALAGKSGDAVRAEIAAFWIRRVFRLFPGVLLWGVIGTLVAIAIPGVFGISWIAALQDLQAALLDYMNVYRYVCQIHGAPCDGPLSAYWSLSLEEQFYLILPAVLVAVPDKWLVRGLVVLIAVQFGFARQANSTDLSFWIRSDGLAWGVLIARFAGSEFWKQLRPSFLNRGLARGVMISVLLLIGSLAGLAGGWEFYYVSIIVLAFAVLVLVASYDSDFVLHEGRAKSALIWIGHRSYSIYLIHVVVLKVAAYLAAGAGVEREGSLLLVVFASIALTIVLADLTYRIVETPLRDKGRELSARLLARSAPSIATGSSPEQVPLQDA